MKIFNYKIIHYKRFSAFFLVLSLIISSVNFLVQKPHTADAAITDCTTEVGNMITNCSFEDPAVLPAGYTPSGVWGYPTFFSGYTGLTGWSFVTPGTGNVTMATGFAGSAQGSRAVDVSGVIDTPAGLNGEIYGSGIEQTVTGLTPGMQYSLKFYQSHLTLAGVTYPSRINVVVDGTSLGVFSHTISTAGDSVGGQVWTQRAVTFIATGTSAVIRFLNDVPTPAPADGAGRPVDLIDSISLTTKPDTTAPTLTISNPADGTVVSGPFTATICPSEPITGLTLSDIIVTNGTPSGLTGPTAVPTSTCAGGQIYTVTITPTTEGEVTITVPATSVIDIAGNTNTSPARIVSVTYDLTPPIFQNVHIASNNPINTTYATTGDTVTITWTVDVGGPDVPVVSNSYAVPFAGLSTISPVSCSGSPIRSCTATIVIGSDAPEGLINFSTTAENNSITQIQNNSTDGSFVIIDRSIHVLITAPSVSDDISTFLLGGECEIGAGNVTISGTGFTPSPVTVPCVDQGDIYGWFEYDPMTGIPGTITITATQTDLAGNIGTDTNVYTYTITPPALPTITISGPLGNANTGSNTITGTCTVSAGNVTISGTGFTPSSGTASCTGAGPLGTYSFPITVTGNTVFTASQTNGAGTAIATGSTVVPTATTSGGGGCLPGYSCSSNTSSSTSTTSSVTTNTAVTATTSTTTNRCPVFTQYLKKGMRDGKNGVSEISKVQSFLNGKLGLNLSVDGIFGKKTHRAVSDFQSMYFTSVLSPWGLTGPTGWWYQSTRSYANYLENCSEGTVQLDNAVKIQDGRIVN